MTQNAIHNLPALTIVDEFSYPSAALQQPLDPCCVSLYGPEIMVG